MKVITNKTEVYTIIAESDVPSSIEVLASIQYRNDNKAVRIFTKFGTIENDFTVNQEHAKLLYEALKEYYKQTT